MNKSKNSGCSNILRGSLQNLGKKQGEINRLALINQLKRNRMPALGLTEPTICGWGTRRLHEINPDSAQFNGTTPTFSAAALVGNKADFAVCQAEANPGHPQFQLPLLWQYDLYHVIEQMPEDRARAAEDDLHSFFHRAEAERTLIAHHDYVSQRGGNFQLLWHTYNPFYSEKDFYEITGQTVAGSAVKWNHINPFGQYPADKMPLADQSRLLSGAIERLAKSSPGRPSDIAEATMDAKLHRIANFASKFKDKAVLFRPYHEHHPNPYFWWSWANLHPDPMKGKTLYKKLWEHTRLFLERRGVDNFVYVYSPDIPNDFSDIDTKAKFLAHFETAMPDVNKIDVLSLTAYLGKLMTVADRSAIQSFSELDDADREAKTRKVLANTFQRLLTLCAWLRERYPNKVVGISETGHKYHLVGGRGNKIYREFWRKEGMKVLQAHPANKRPHFITFWRSDAQGSYFPHPGKPNTFSKEVTAIVDVLKTQVADFPKPIA